MKCPFCGRIVGELKKNKIYRCECGTEYMMLLPEDASGALFSVKRDFGPDVDVKTQSRGGYIILFVKVKKVKNR